MDWFVNFLNQSIFEINRWSEMISVYCIVFIGFKFFSKFLRKSVPELDMFFMSIHAPLTCVLVITGVTHAIIALFKTAHSHSALTNLSGILCMISIFFAIISWFARKTKLLHRRWAILHSVLAIFVVLFLCSHIILVKI